MNNFGVIEIAGAKTTNAPGWAYVPDVAISAGAAAIQPSNRKRAARNTANPSQSDLTARQDAKIRKELEALDRDSQRDANILIPPRPGAGRATKSTANVRKILQSQKTFANHLDDYQALVIQAESNPAAAAALLGNPPPPPKASTPAPKPATPVTKRTAAQQKRSDAAAKRAAAKAKIEAAEAEAAKEAEEAKAKEADADGDGDGDVSMTDAPAAGPSEGGEAEAAAPAEPEGPTSYPPDGTILPAYQKPPPKPHPGDDDPLLVSAIPPFPTDEELRALISAPPLSYLEARAHRGEGENRYPGRTFCVVCGYWGRVRCMKCGTRVCALGCLDVHREEECVTRYWL
ncbi:hypothetical protein GQ53DRAFT_747246 [Thozetella sp. PMI_491]|nr:hypothetical protein GQ53DRAFT_747246 [Thozetella sp. PMI_491]